MSPASDAPVIIGSMSDTTLISITAVLVAGVAGPGITALATTRGQGKKFKHERKFRDLEEIRQLIDETGTALNEVIRECSNFGPMVHQLGIGQASSAVLTELEQKLEEFEAVSARLRIRAGLASEIAEVCGRLIEAVELLQAQVTYLGILIPMLNSEKIGETNRATWTTDFTNSMEKLMDESKALRELRPVYIAAAHRLAGADLSEAT